MSFSCPIKSASIKYNHKISARLVNFSSGTFPLEPAKESASCSSLFFVLYVSNCLVSIIILCCSGNSLDGASLSKLKLTLQLLQSLRLLNLEYVLLILMPFAACVQHVCKIWCYSRSFVSLVQNYFKFILI